MPLRLPARFALVVAVALCLPTAAPADNGVLEINHTCAIHTGCFSGDSPGFPVTINGSAGRSYRLTSDLHTSNANTTLIDIASAARGVSFDLNGFGLTGPTECSGIPVLSCSPAGNGTGVLSAAEGTSVGNGFIRGMGRDGVRLSNAYSRVHDLTISDCGDDGVETSGSAQVESVVAVENGDDGLVSIQFGNNVVNSVFTNNGGDGVDLSQRSQVRGSQFGRNRAFGLRAGANVGYSHNSFYGNDAGTEVDGGLNLGGNSCDSIVCP